MDFQKSKTLLDKINALYKNISSDPRNVSSIERDLMRSYIQQFYESFLELPTTAASVTPAHQHSEAKATEPRITLRKPESAPPPPPLVPQPEPPRPETPKVERIPEPVTEPPSVERIPEPAKEPPVEIKAPAAVQAEAPPPAPAKTHSHSDPDIDDLFAFKSATELSEKLSELPILDIKKAMGLNERIAVLNELFGADAATFESTLTTLNQLRSFEDAKDYLVRGVASKYNWSSKERKTKAKAFIKLIRRRY